MEVLDRSAHVFTPTPQFRLVLGLVQTGEGHNQAFDAEGLCPGVGQGQLKNLPQPGYRSHRIFGSPGSAKTDTRGVRLDGEA